MSIEFDIGPLTWVKDEIDHALSEALANAESFISAPGNVTLLRHCLTHVHQVSGALSMIGLDGAQRFSLEIERYVSWLEKHAGEAESESTKVLTKSLQALSTYLQQLVEGAPDVPLRLFPEFKAMLEAQGVVRIQESELFFPDLSVTAPGGLEVEIPEADALPAHLLKLCQDYRKYLVQWIHQPESKEALAKMHDTLLAVERCQALPGQKTLWWAAVGLLEAVAQGGMEVTLNLRHLCVRLERQLHYLALGTPRPVGRLLRDVLYHLAMGQTVNQRVGDIKRLFGLDFYQQEPEVSESVNLAGPASDDAALIKALLKSVSELKACWEQVSSLDTGRLAEFQQKSADLCEMASTSENSDLRQALSDIHDCANELIKQASPADVLFSIEMATSLLMLEGILSSGLRDDNSLRNLTSQTAAMRSMLLGEVQTAPVLETGKAESLAVLTQVAEEIRSNLQRIEQVLDDFFRSPEARGELAALTGLFRQVSGAFEMLDQPIAASVIKDCLVLVDRFVKPGYHAGEGEYDLVAESISALGFYLDRLVKHDADAEQVISSLPARLQIYLDAVPAFMAVSETEEAELEQAQVTPERVEDHAHDEELLEVYLTEAHEVLDAIASGMEALSHNRDDHQSLVNVRRGFHTLKGSGRTVGLVAMGDVAWSVEQLLNHLIETRIGVDEAVIDYVARVSRVFLEWVQQLQTTGSVTLVPAIWQAEAAALRHRVVAEETGTEVVDEPVKPKAADEIVIGGTKKVSHQLFNLFLEEAYANLEMLSRVCSAAHKKTPPPIPDVARAAHTLGGVSRTVGFTALGEVSAALEDWLESITPRLQQLTAEELLMFDQAMSTLLGMLLNAANRRQPKPAPWLCSALRSAAGPVTPSALADELEQAQQREVPLEEEAIEGQQAAEAAVTSMAEQEEAPAAEVLSAEGEPAPNVGDDAQQHVPKTGEEGIDRELLDIFLEESNELMPLVGAQLRQWQESHEDAAPKEALLRALHTLKGSARMAGANALGDAYHDLESLIIRAAGRGLPTARNFSNFYKQFDEISDALESLRSSSEVPSIVTEVAAKPSEQVPATVASMMRVRSEVIDRLVNEAGEISIARSRVERQMETFKQALLELTDSVIRVRSQLREVEIEAETQMQSRMSQIQEAHETFDPLEFDRYTRFQELTRMMAESVHDVATIQQGLLYNLSETEAALLEQSRMNKELQQGLMRTRMVRFGSVAERLHRIVRQTSAELGKQAILELEGGNVEIDRSVLEKMIAPLEHLLRNAVAHGLESDAERARLGKPAKGRVDLRVRQDGNEIILSLSDDGRGLDYEKVKTKAQQLGMYDPRMETESASLMSLIFEPGFSTSDTVTQVSGRGVGLDAVRSDIASLGGRVEVTSEAGSGTCFTVYLPLTLAVNQSVLVRTGEDQFLLPAPMVEQVQKLKPDALATCEQQGVVAWAGYEYPVHHLSRLLGKPVQLEPQQYTPVMLLRSGARRIALIVDEIAGNREIVVKNIGPQLASMTSIAGATVMGDGKVMLILNPIQMAFRESVVAEAMHHVMEETAETEIQHVPTVMVVDDSLTMRKVITRLLTREGYHALTAKDGVDALQQLQSVVPDVILLDIEMPRMDGFELARAIRGDARTADIPLIVISSRTADKHRKYAAELGVNVYLGKPYQEEELLSHISTFLGAEAGAEAIAEPLPG